MRTDQPLPKIQSFSLDDECNNCPHRLYEHDYPAGCTKCSCVKFQLRDTWVDTE